MATPLQVKQYLAAWFQMGKGVVAPRLPEGRLFTNRVMMPDLDHNLTYSPEFEQCWAQINLAPGMPGYLGDSHLEGTSQTIQELLSNDWDIDGCARCGMQVSLKVAGFTDSTCPCSDMPEMPNDTTIQPAAPRSNRVALGHIHNRLSRLSKD
jgi:hypothetical protein